MGLIGACYDQVLVVQILPIETSYLLKKCTSVKKQTWFFSHT